MGCQIHSSNPQILSKTLNNRCTHFSPISSVQSRFIIQAKILSSSYEEKNLQNPFSTGSTVSQTKLQTEDEFSVKFMTLGACKLGISKYPDFEYNAKGGTGTGTGRKIMGSDSYGEFSVKFDLETLYIPPLTTATTKFLGLPLPPLLKIDIVPENFHGNINQESGKVDLKFKANFLFSVGNIYKAPPLLVETELTSEESKGMMRSGRGERLDKEGKCKLVGMATVEPIDDFLMNSFLGLPTECLASLNAIISFPNA